MNGIMVPCVRETQIYSRRRQQYAGIKYDQRRCHQEKGDGRPSPPFGQRLDPANDLRFRAFVSTDLLALCAQISTFARRLVLLFPLQYHSARNPSVATL